MFGLGLGKLGNNYKVHLRRKRGFFPPGTPQAIREALVCWYDPARQGCTNGNMAANPVLKDLSGNGHDMPCHNFAWAGMSGIGGYGFDIKGTFPRNYTGDPLYVCNDHLINVRSLGVGTGLLQVKNIKTVEDYVEVPPFRIRVSGVADAEKRYPGLHWNNIYYYVDETTKLGKVINVSADGEYDLPRSVVPDTMQSFLGFVESHNKETVEAAGGRISVDIRIEIPPSYPGALVSDGVDDYGVAEGLPILTDYTVIAKRKYISEKNGSLAKKRGDAIYGEFDMENRYNDTETRTRSFMSWNALPDGFASQDVTCQTRLSYNGAPIVGMNGDTDGHTLTLARGINAALYSFLLFSRTLSEEEIEWVKANMVNGYPSSVAYYDCSKYSNGDMGDNPVLEDLSGNGHDLELRNFAFGGMSGFGGYNWNFNNFLRATYPHTDSAVRFDLSNPPGSYANEFTGYIEPGNIPDVLKGAKIKVSGIANSSFNLYYQINLLPSGSVRKDIVVDKDGTYEFPDVDLSQYEKINNVYYGISHLDTPASDIIDVELIPEYPGGLVFDGVDDYCVNGNFPSYNCKTLMMLFKHGNANSHKIYFDCRLDASTEYAVLFDTENIAFQARNKNGKTYINNKMNDSLRPKDLAGKKYLVAITNGSAEKGTMIKFGGNNTDASGYYANMVLYKALLFDKVLTQKQMDKVIQDYHLMDGVDDVWNENNN